MAMLDEDRQNLAEKLDEDLEKFVAQKLSKPREKVPEDNRTVDEIAEELKQHPAFMTEIDYSKPLSPMVEGLQALKYDSEQSDFNAESYKDDGNDNFKKKKYKWAIDSYTMGIRQKCTNRQLNAILYCNRAASHYHLQNYASSLRDATIAVKFNPEHMKAIVRAAECCVEIKKYADAIKWCDTGLSIDKNQKVLLDLRPKADKLMRAEEKEKRKEMAKERKEQVEEQKLLDLIKSRGVKLAGAMGDNKKNRHPLLFTSIESYNPAGAKVHLDSTGVLQWPVLFLYPEYGETDFIASFSENASLEEHISVMFAEPPPWDSEHKYKGSDIQVYFEDTSNQKLIRLKKTSTLGDILKHEKYVVYGGSPGFILIVKNSKFAEQFLAKYQ